MATVNHDIKVRIDALIAGMPNVQAFSAALKHIKTQGNSKFNINTTGAERGLTNVTGLIRKLSPQADGLINKFEGVGRAAGLSLGSIAGPAAVATAGVAVLSTAVVGLGVAVFGLLEKFAEHGSKLHDFKENTGLAAETVSTLSFATQQGGKDLDTMGAGIKKFSALIADAARGSDEAKAKLKSLGIDPQKALKDLDGALGQAIKRIFEAKPGLEQMTLAADAFGKRSGPDLIATINTMNGDLPKFIEHARKLGVVLGEEDLRAADEFGDTLDLLKAQAGGVANQFSAELAPEVVRAMKDMSKAMGDNESAAREWGRSVSDFIRGVREVAESEIGQAIIFFGKLAFSMSATSVLARAFTLRGNANRGSGAGNDAINEANAASVISATEGAAKNVRLEDLSDVFSPSGRAGKGGGGGAKRTVPDVLESVFGVTRANIESVFNLFKDQLERQEKALKESYESRRITIAEFYAEDLRLQTATIDAELKKIGQLRIAEQDQLAGRIAQLQADKSLSPKEREAKIAIEQNKSQQDLNKLTERFVILMRDRAELAGEVGKKEAAATEALSAEADKAIEILDALNGKTRANASAIDRLLELRTNIVAERGEDDFLVKAIDEATELLGLIDQLDNHINQFQRSQQLNEARIGTLQEQGNQNLIARFLTDRQIIAIKRQQLKDYEEELRLVQAIAQTTTNPEILSRLEQLRLGIARLKNETKSLGQTIKDTFLDAAVGGIEEFLMSMDDIIAGTISITEAFRNMALSIIEELQRIIAQMIAMKIVEMSLKLLSGGGGGDSAGLGGFGEGLGAGFATGGPVRARPGGRIIKVAEGGHDEMVVTTDPRHALRSAKLLGRFIRRTGILPRFAAGGFTSESIMSSISDRLPRFAMGDFVSGSSLEPAVAGNTYLSQQFVFPNVKDYRSFKQNEAAMKRDLGRAAQQGIARIRGAR